MTVCRYHAQQLAQLACIISCSGKCVEFAFIEASLSVPHQPGYPVDTVGYPGVPDIPRYNYSTTLAWPQASSLHHYIRLAEGQ